MFCFILWREFRMCISEIFNVFKNIEFVFVNESFCILDNITKEDILKNYHKIWWTMKVVEIIKQWNNVNNFIEFSSKYIQNIWTWNWKINFAVAFYWPDVLNNFTIWYQIKKSLKNKNLSIRLVNNSNENINSAVFKKEKLKKFETELNYINLWSKIFFWKTIIYQDVDEYSKRDISKIRDMQIWMLPPKLAQIMLNISWENISVYDPFVWLWTVLIEAINSWFTNIIWSDIKEDLVEKTLKNIKEFSWTNLNINIFQLDASKIFENLPKNIHDKIINANIVTEWFLWEIMTKNNITIEKININKEHLIWLYKWFFSWLKKLNFKWTIVISFPFWEVKWKYVYFEEIYKLFRFFNIKTLQLLPEEIQFKTTKYWSLLYKKNDQQVWREIFKLKF